MPKNEVRILIDRIPNTLEPSQAPDAMAQRILPLLKEQNYHLEAPVKWEDFTLSPPSPDAPKLHFIYVRDELTRAMLFMGARADVLYDTLSLSKTSWIKKQGVRTLEASGLSLSFVGFQLNDPLLKDVRVRRAIQLSFPIGDWVHYKMFDWVEILPEVKTTPDLPTANHLLDEAGKVRDANGERFTLHYLTTPVREGNEMAYLVREALKPLGIRLEIIPLETSLFFNRLKRGDFQMFFARIFRNTASDPVSDFLSPKGVRNYFQYTALPDHPFAWDEVKMQVFQDLPLIPLFTWKHVAVVSERITWDPNTVPPLDDSFRFLSSLRLK